ncbi:DUF7504 family protein [Halobacterium hubeiense]|uniref:DUF7504 family protein n=1 Tax=Halobacterium hubeiense TaxID=1407499 RepID=UPI00117BAC07|nr:hypothetical protein [Halobacterium hubeiense]
MITRTRMRGGGSAGGSTHVLVTGADAVATDADVPPASNVLGITYETAAETWLGEVQSGPERTAVVSVGEHSRAAAAAPAEPTAAASEDLAVATAAVETVPEVADVASVGVLVNDYVSAWDDETTVYVDDFSALLDPTSTETAFRFAHALTSCAAANDARVVAGLDTADRPSHVAATFAELFDDVREV